MPGFKRFSKTEQKKEVQPLGRTLLSEHNFILCHSIKIVNITLAALHSHDESIGHIVAYLLAFFKFYSFFQDIHYFHLSSPLTNSIRGFDVKLQGFSRTKLNICIPRRNTFYCEKEVTKCEF